LSRCSIPTPIRVKEHSSPLNKRKKTARGAVRSANQRLKNKRANIPSQVQCESRRRSMSPAHTTTASARTKPHMRVAARSGASKEFYQQSVPAYPGHLLVSDLGEAAGLLALCHEPCSRSLGQLTPASALNDPEHWRQRSEEARRMADLISDKPSKEAMLRIAEDYERHAKRAEERAERSP
jgi:hypothetical protein